MWEDKSTADKTWTDAKTYFEDQIAKIEDFTANSARTAAESKYESAANMNESETDMNNAGDQLQEYLKSLKAADTTKKEEYAQQMSSDTMAEMNTKFEAKLTAKDKQITMFFKQNEAILKTLTRLSLQKAEKTFLSK